MKFNFLILSDFFLQIKQGGLNPIIAKLNNVNSWEMERE